MKAKKLKIFMPSIVAAVVSIVTLIIYLCVLKEAVPFRIGQIVAAPIVALIIPLVNKICKIKIPFAVNVVVTIHAVLALDFAAALDFYSRLPLTDKFLHTYFGFYGSMILFIIMLYLGGQKMNKWGFFAFILLGILGIGVLWEIWEFTTDNIFGYNSQRWHPTDEMIAGGLSYVDYIKWIGNPMTDTMWDLIVTLFGGLLFYVFIFIDKLCGYKFCRSIYKDVKNKDVQNGDVQNIDVQNNNRQEDEGETETKEDNVVVPKET
jgi:hypothetical protein